MTTVFGRLSFAVHTDPETNKRIGIELMGDVPQNVAIAPEVFDFGDERFVTVYKYPSGIRDILFHCETRYIKYRTSHWITDMNAWGCTLVSITPRGVLV